jgi:hypothetical protein
MLPEQLTLKIELVLQFFNFGIIRAVRRRRCLELGLVLELGILILSLPKRLLQLANLFLQSDDLLVPRACRPDERRVRLRPVQGDRARTGLLSFPFIPLPVGLLQLIPKQIHLFRQPLVLSRQLLVHVVQMSSNLGRLGTVLVRADIVQSDSRQRCVPLRPRRGPSLVRSEVRRGSDRDERLVARPLIRIPSTQDARAQVASSLHQPPVKRSDHAPLHATGERMVHPETDPARFMLVLPKLGRGDQLVTPGS